MNRYLPSDHAQQAHCYTWLPQSCAIQWLSPSGRVGPGLRSDAPPIRSRKSEDRDDGQALRGVAIQVEAVLLSRRWPLPGGLGSVLPYLLYSGKPRAVQTKERCSKIQVYAQDKGISPNISLYLLAILNAASVFGRITPNFFADYLGNLNLMVFMCTGAGILAFSVFGAGTAGGAIAVSIFYGFFSGGYVSLIGPALISMATHPSEIGIRIGMGKSSYLEIQVVCG
jgi:hypothetical protein